MNGLFGPHQNLRDTPLRDRRAPLSRFPLSNTHDFIRTIGFGAGPAARMPYVHLNRYSEAVAYGYPINTSSGVSLLPASLAPNNQLAPLNPNRSLGGLGGLGRLGSNYDDNDIFAFDSDPWQPNHLHCTTNSSSCQSSCAGSYLFETKDIVLRGKAKVIRKSYLQESPKFEADLMKYLDKKTEEQVPERVVDMLITFINQDCYGYGSVIDEVTLNILAFTVGAKSVCESSLTRLKKDIKDAHCFANWRELGIVTGTILMCTKVDPGLTAWLKKILGANENRAAQMLVNNCRHFEALLGERPELGAELERLLGLRPPPKDDNKYRSL